MKKISLAVIAAAILPVTSLAQDQNNYLCSQGDLQRRVEIVYETGVTVPCEVHYYKDTEAPGERQVLWRAMSQEGYCEQKTREFVTQLAAWGWKCTQSTGAAADEVLEPDEIDEIDEIDEPDDTEALEPVDEVEATEET